jgi:predicted RNA-binding protein with PUA-like domain
MYWLVKSEPDEYSWQDLVKDKVSVWTGIRNYQARNNLRSMKVGDLVFYYHSNIGKDIVGIAKVVKESHQDPTTEDERWLSVDLEPVESLKKSVKLDDIKANPKLESMQLVRNSRLSVQKVTDAEWNEVLRMSNRG